MKKPLPKRRQLVSSIDGKLESSSTKNHWPLIIILLKLGPKLAPILTKLIGVLTKLLKGLFGFKAIGAAGSLGLYSLVFTWQMALAIIIFILVHEYGHLRAMKKCGLKTKGIYLIPGFGGAAIADERWKSSQDEAYIAIMGPVFSLWFIIPAIIIYFITKDPIFAAIASLTSFINLFNLFPINPLDGGRVVKSLLYSIQGSFGFYFSFISVIIATIISIKFGLSLLAIISVIGLMEIFNDYGLFVSMKKFSMTVARCFYLIIVGLFGFLPTVLWIAGFTQMSITGIIMTLAFDALGLVILLFDMSVTTGDKGLINYPIILINDFFMGIKEIFTFNHDNLKTIEGYQPMNKKYLFYYAGIYAVTIMIMISLMIYTAQIPGAEIGKEMLK